MAGPPGVRSCRDRRPVVLPVERGAAHHERARRASHLRGPLVGVVIATALGNREHLGAAGLTGFLLGVAGVALIVGYDLRAADATALVEIGLVVIGYAVGPVI